MTSKIPLVDLQAQYATIKAEVGEAIDRILSSCKFILGEEVKLFEQEFAAACGAKHGIGVASGTSAIHLALTAVGVKPGDEVITTPFTFIATAEAISHCGAKPVFVDVDPKTYNIDPAKIERAITKKTRAILPVHLYGQPVDVDAILEVARKHGLKVVEDAAQAHDALYKGRRVGSLADAACFSFYPGKNLGAYGDAGGVVTNDAAVADTVRLLRDHGRRDKYEHLVVGYGERIDALHAAVLRVKLKKLAGWTKARRQAAARYDSLLAGIPGLQLPYVLPGVDPCYHLYVVRTDRREELQKALSEAGIESGRHYPIPLHLQPAYKDLGYKPGDFPSAELAARTVVSLPLYPELPAEAQERAAGVARKVLGAPQTVRA